MSKQRRSEAGLIKLKLKKFGIRAAILKAIEETSELLSELETLLLIWDGPVSPTIPQSIAENVSNIAEEYADVTVAVYDTFKRIWLDEFAQIVEVKRRLVYEKRLPKLLNGDDNVK